MERMMSCFVFFIFITNVLIFSLFVNIEIKGFLGFLILFRGSYEDVMLDWYVFVMRLFMIIIFINVLWFGLLCFV